MTTMNSSAGDDIVERLIDNAHEWDISECPTRSATASEAAHEIRFLRRWQAEASLLLDRIYEIADTIPNQLLGSSKIENIAAELHRLRIERAHCLGCEHSVDPPHRCYEETCYRQWQADEIDRLRGVIGNAAVELVAEHRSIRLAHGEQGHDGCVVCWPESSGWPCISRMIAEDLERVSDGTSLT